MVMMMAQSRIDESLVVVVVKNNAHLYLLSMCSKKVRNLFELFVLSIMIGIMNKKKLLLEFFNIIFFLLP